MGRHCSKNHRKLAPGLLGWMGLAIFFLSPVTAHEFWISPQQYTAAQGERIPVQLKVGQMMEGADYPYLSHSFHSFTVNTSEGTSKATGNEGDIPALTFDAQTPGLNIIGYHATAHTLTYDSFGEFVEYLEYEGLGAIAELHRSRGLPVSGFTEAYTRYAKALLQIGPVRPRDIDRALGFRLELIASKNPYTAGIEVLPVTLRWQGQPVAGAQISIFRRDSAVTRKILTSDARGQANIAVREVGEYLLNAVYMVPDNADNVVWQSHWASLTFKIQDNK